MSHLNLDQFIIWARNRTRVGSSVAWVNEPKFSGLYVRYGRRHLRTNSELDVLETFNDVLDIANVTVEVAHQRQGVFTALIHRLRETYPEIGIYVENAMPETMQPLLRRLQFKIARQDDVLGHHSWFLPPLINKKS